MHNRGCGEMWEANYENYASYAWIMIMQYIIGVYLFVTGLNGVWWFCIVV